MMKYHLVNMSLVALLFIACSNGPGYDEKAEFKGHLSQAKNTKLSLEQLTATKIIPLDSATTDEQGRFYFAFSPKEAGFYRITESKTNYLNFIWMPGDMIFIEAEASNLPLTHVISGSAESDILTKFNKGLDVIYKKNDSLNKTQQMARSMGNYQAMGQAQNALQELNDMHSNYVKSFITEHPSSLASLAAVQKLSMDDDFDYFLKVEEGLKSRIPNSTIFKDYSAVISQSKRLSVGYEAPELMLNDPDGKPIALSSLRGKVVLIDFWASWCRPCRAENPNVVKMYAKYKDKGFEILGVSLDNKKEAWLGAIAQDKLTWKHVSDLKGWQSAAAPLYKVSGIPMTYLLDKDGKIVGKNLRGPALEQKLNEIFK